MKIAIAGGTGFVGSALVKELLNHNHEVYILTRRDRPSTNPKLHYIGWLADGFSPEQHLEGIDAVINLAGESINSGRWTDKRKASILESRLKTTREIKRIVNALTKKPDVLVNASAIGIYGTSLEETFSENSTKKGSDFLANTVIQWEKEASSITNIRTVFTRFGIILGKDEGALPRMVLPYKFFIGGTVGSGKQWLSWIHIEDCVSAIIFALENKNIQGAINLVSPNPVRMKEFGQTIGRTLRKPHWIPVPDFALKLLLGEMSILVLEGQKVLPDKLTENQFTFRYPSLDDALKNILQS